MPTNEYTHPEWAQAKRHSDHGKVSDKGSFPRQWLDSQQDGVIANWGITKNVIPDPTPPPPPTQAEIDAKIEAAIQDRLGDITQADLITVLTEMVNVERENRSIPVPRITEVQFKQFVRALLGL